MKISNTVIVTGAAILAIFASSYASTTILDKKVSETKVVEANIQKMLVDHQAKIETSLKKVDLSTKDVAKAEVKKAESNASGTPSSFNEEAFRENIKKFLDSRQVKVDSTKGIVISDKKYLGNIEGLEVYGLGVVINVEGQKKPIVQPIVVTASGSIMISGMQDMKAGTPLFVNEMSQINEKLQSLVAVKLDKSVGGLVAKGTGTNEVSMVSDPFCPYCREAYKFIVQNMDKLSELRLVHLPLDMHPGADVASLFMTMAEKTGLAPVDQVVKYAYTDLPMPQRGEAKDKIEVDITKFFLVKFPALAKELGSEPKLALAKLKEKYEGHLREDVEVAKQFGIEGTPAFFVNKELVSGFDPNSGQPLKGKISEKK